MMAITKISSCYIRRPTGERRRKNTDFNRRPARMRKHVKFMTWGMVSGGIVFVQNVMKIGYFSQV